MSCSAPTIIVGGVELSTSDFENAKELLNTVSGDNGDPTLDGYEESVAGGNNINGTTGVQVGNSATQTTPPAAIDVPAGESNAVQSSPKQGAPVACPLPAFWYTLGSTELNYDAALSPNFKVRHFSVNAVFKNQIIDLGTLTKEERCCNLLNLAVNIAEPIRAKFGNFNINSAIRNQNSVPNGVSQHVAGAAMDIQFPGWTYDTYWQNATWVRDNLPYDQFIFEHSDKTGSAWYHLSYKKAGGNRTQVLTMYRNKYSPGLMKFY